jgi:hypothetical protein
MDGSRNSVVGEALAFYELLKAPKQVMVVCRLLTKMEDVLGAWRGIWSSSLTVLPAAQLVDNVGIWQAERAGAKVWALRKHPGLAMLTAAETDTLDSDEKVGSNDNSDIE